MLLEPLVDDIVAVIRKRFPPLFILCPLTSKGSQN